MPFERNKEYQLGIEAPIPDIITNQTNSLSLDHSHSKALTVDLRPCGDLQKNCLKNHIQCQASSVLEAEAEAEVEAAEAALFGLKRCELGPRLIHRPQFLSHELGSE